jgi:hypothetical protein
VFGILVGELPPLKGDFGGQRNERAYLILDIPDKVNLTCLMVRGSVIQKTSVPVRCALADSCSLPRKTM